MMKPGENKGNRVGLGGIGVERSVTRRRETARQQDHKNKRRGNPR